MRFKLDENLPRAAAEQLRDLAHDADTVVDEGIAGTEDLTVLKAATSEGRIVVTLDLNDLEGCVSVWRDGRLRRRPARLA